ncbi:MAG: ABC transporter permease [Bryobacteraceae bacterium]
MPIPITYNIRNLAVRKTTTVMTALGIALTVAVLCAVLSMVEGLRVAFTSSGHPLNLLLIRKGSGAELTSMVSRNDFNEVIRFRPGIAPDAEGQPLASLELVTIINLPSREFPEGVNVNVRGVSATGLELRDETRLRRGRWFQRGRREVVVGSEIAAQNPDAQVGQSIRFGRGEWLIVGVFDSSYPARNSEIWGDLDQVRSDLNRFDACSSVLLRATDPVALQTLTSELSVEQRLQLDVQPETEYFAKQTDSGEIIRYLGTFVAIIMAVGSCFAAMNTMYAAVARRSQEIGTLRVLGFSRFSILLCFVLESVLISLLGGALGLVLILPLHGLSTDVGSMTTFAETSFQLAITPKVVVSGLAFALIMGALGGFLPAFSAARKQVLVALRQI